MAIDYGTFYWNTGSGGGGGGGGGGSGAQAAGTATLASASQSFSVSYDVTLASAIAPIFSFINTVDASPIFLDGYVSAFSTTGFTVKTNALTDTANYKLVYAVFGAV